MKRQASSGDRNTSEEIKECAQTGPNASRVRWTVLEEPRVLPGRNRTRSNCVVCRLTGTTQGSMGVSSWHRCRSSRCRTTAGTRYSGFSKIAPAKEPPHAAQGNWEVDPAVCVLSRKPIITNPPAQLTHWYDSDHPWSPLARLQPRSPTPGLTSFSAALLASVNHPDNRPAHLATPGSGNAPDRPSSVSPGTPSPPLQRPP